MGADKRDFSARERAELHAALDALLFRLGVQLVPRQVWEYERADRWGRR
jgi:hypothetical protein